jgi:3-oxoacyl-(acyl-carrier-protein) synthase
VAGDRLESDTLHVLWDGAPLPPVLAPKSVTAEYGGVHLAAAILATAGAEFGPTVGYETFDPALRVTPHAGGPLPALRRVLVTSLAGGGAGAWVVLERP